MSFQNDPPIHGINMIILKQNSSSQKGRGGERSWWAPSMSLPLCGFVPTSVIPGMTAGIPVSSLMATIRLKL